LSRIGGIGKEALRVLTAESGGAAETAAREEAPAMKSVTIRADGNLRIDYVQGGDANALLAFTFTNWAPPGATSLDGPGYAGRFLLAHGFDVVAFKSNRNYWFQDVDEADLARVEQAVAGGGRAYARRVGYGSSMGGYAAIQFSGALRLDRVLAFSPQFAIAAEWDRRWAREASAIAFRHEIDRRALAPGCDYVVAFDPQDADIDHVRRFAALIAPERLREIRLPHSGHPTGDFIAETGHLKPFALAVLRDGTPPPLQEIRRDRRRSKSFLWALALHCARRARPRVALTLIERAIAMDATKPHFHWQRSLLLDRLGDLDGAVAAQRHAVALDPADPHQHACLSHLLGRQGAFDAALAAIDRAIALDAGQAGFHAHRSALLDRLNDVEAALAAAERAVLLGPGDAQALVQLSQILARKDQLDAALDCAARAVSLSPGNPWFRRHLAALHDRAGRGDLAIDAMREVVRLAPGEPDHAGFLAALEKRQGERRYAAAD